MKSMVTGFPSHTCSLSRKYQRYIRKLSTQGTTSSQYSELVFLRHGQSLWNKQNIFIGMTDIRLTDEGVQEARGAGALLKEALYNPDIVYTSLLQRSTKTVWLVMEELQLEWVPVVKDWRLNERNYGALVGKNKKECVLEHGKDQVKRWRRSWDEPPPPMSKDSKYWPGHEARYKALGIDEDMIPLSESLKDVTKRTSLFWDDVIVPQIKQGKRVLIVGHENNLRSMIKRLDDISEEAIIEVELPRAIPLLYHINRQTLKPVKLPGTAERLNGKYLGDQNALQTILERDYKQVYDVSPAASISPSLSSYSPLDEYSNTTSKILGLGLESPPSHARRITTTTTTGE